MAVQAYKNVGEAAGFLAFDILRNNFHQPIVDGKCNRDGIEDAVTVGIMAGDLTTYVDQEIVDLAIKIIDDLIGNHGVSSDSVAKGT